MCSKRYPLATVRSSFLLLRCSKTLEYLEYLLSYYQWKKDADECNPRKTQQQFQRRKCRSILVLCLSLREEQTHLEREYCYISVLLACTKWLCLYSWLSAVVAPKTGLTALGQQIFRGKGPAVMLKYNCAFCHPPATVKLFTTQSGLTTACLLLLECWSTNLPISFFL